MMPIFQNGGAGGGDPFEDIATILADWDTYTWRADDPTNVFQDDAGTVQAVAAGDPVRSIYLPNDLAQATLSPRNNTSWECELEEIGGHLVVTNPTGLPGEDKHFSHDPSSMTGSNMTYWVVSWNTGTDSGPDFWAQNSTLTGWSGSTKYAGNELEAYGGSLATFPVTFAAGFNLTVWDRNNSQVRAAVNGNAFPAWQSAGTRYPGFGRKAFFWGRGQKIACLVHACLTNSTTQITQTQIDQVSALLKARYGIT